MYKEVRTRLTFLFSSVTCALLLALLSISFFLSAKSRYSMQLTAFSNQSATLADEARTSNVLTTDWMTSRESAASCYLFLLDQGVPAFHNSTQPQEMQNLFNKLSPYFVSEVSNAWSESSDFHTSLPSSLHQISASPSVYLYSEGLFSSAFFCEAQIAKNNSVLSIFTIQPLDALMREFSHTVLLYVLLFLTAGLILIAFSWYFTGRLLQPLLDAQESQNRFVSAASHELRTPLAVILANTSACKKAPAHEQAPFFAVIEREGEQMTTMLEQLLILSRADSRSLRLQLSATDLQTLLLEIYGSFLPLFKENGYFLHIQLPEEEIPLCQCDAFRIEQVCTILLRNAMAHTPSGTRVLFALSFDHNCFSLSVQDNGPGISDSEKELIFDRFYHGAKSTKEKGHHGLGLAVAREIAVTHKGQITVKDAPGGGTIFTLMLPCITV